MARTRRLKTYLFQIDSVLPDDQSLPIPFGLYWEIHCGIIIFRKNCCGPDVCKIWIYACIGMADTNGCTENSKLTSRPLLPFAVAIGHIESNIRKLRFRTNGSSALRPDAKKGPCFETEDTDFKSGDLFKCSRFRLFGY